MRGLESSAHPHARNDAGTCPRQGPAGDKMGKWTTGRHWDNGLAKTLSRRPAGLGQPQ